MRARPDTHTYTPTLPHSLTTYTHTHSHTKNRPTCQRVVYTRYTAYKACNRCAARALFLYMMSTQHHTRRGRPAWVCVYVCNRVFVFVPWNSALTLYDVLEPRARCAMLHHICSSSYSAHTHTWARTPCALCTNTRTRPNYVWFMKTVFSIYGLPFVYARDVYAAARHQVYAFHRA